MDNLQERLKTRVMRKHGSLKSETEALITAAQDKQYGQITLKQPLTNPRKILDVECAETKMKLSVISSAVAQKFAQKERKNIMWPGQSTGICRKNAGSTGMINGTITSLKAYWKMRTTNSLGTSIYQQTITSRRPDLVLVDKSKRSCHVIDVAIPEDGEVKEKEAEKVEKHQNLARELKRMWEVKTKVVPVVLVALGTVPLRLKGNLKDIGVDTSITLIQKSALLGSARILRKVLEM